MKTIKQADEQLRRDAAVLGLPRSFFYLEKEQQVISIKTAFKDLCKIHPDKGGDEERFRQILESRERLNEYDKISITDVYKIFLIEKTITAEQFIKGKYRVSYSVEVYENGSLRSSNRSKTIDIDNFIHLNAVDLTFCFFQDDDCIFGDIYLIQYPTNITMYENKLYYLIKKEVCKEDLNGKTLSIHGKIIEFDSDAVRNQSRIIDISEFRALFVSIMPIIKL